jgi:hypothetical protein
MVVVPAKSIFRRTHVGGDAMQGFDGVSTAYLVAGLCLGEQFDGYVDSYHGPDDLRASAANIAPDVALDRLDAEIDVLEGSPRKTFLLAQAASMRAVHAMAGGGEARFAEQVAMCFDIQPEWVDEDEFESAHYALDQLLPGNGDLAERRQAYRKGFEIELDRVLPLAERILADLRERTATIIDLPEGESVELRLVSGQPWSGYNWYLGNVSSRIELNTDLPIRLNDLPDLLAHEAYPGHHTEHSVREHVQMHGQGFGEFAIALLISPQAVVSEGIATNALDVVVPPPEQAAWLAEHVYQPAGTSADLETDLAISHAARALAGVRGNVALMLNERGATPEEAVDYMVRYDLRSDEEARRSIGFLTHPLFRTYIYTYTAGYEIVSNFLSTRTSPADGFRSLLTEHWTPTRLRGTGKVRSSDDERLPF